MGGIDEEELLATALEIVDGASHLIPVESLGVLVGMLDGLVREMADDDAYISVSIEAGREMAERRLIDVAGQLAEQADEATREMLDLVGGEE